VVLFAVVMIVLLVTMVPMVFPGVVVRTAVDCKDGLLTLRLGSVMVMVMIVVVTVVVSMIVMVSMLVSMVMVVVMVMVLVIRWGATAIDAHSTNLRISSRGPIFSPTSL